MLALVVGALVLLLAYPLRQYVEHRARVAALQAENEQRQDTVQELEQQVARLSDPSYVKAQARERLHFVMPGETGFLTLPKSGNGSTETLNHVEATFPDDEPWYGRLWSSVQAASGVPQERSGGGSDQREGR